MLIELGDRVKEVISGATGIVVARTTWLTGCVRLTIEIGLDKVKGEVVRLSEDEERFKIIRKGAYQKARESAPAGPMPLPRKVNTSR